MAADRERASNTWNIDANMTDCELSLKSGQ